MEMLDLPLGLPTQTLQAIADLERRTVKADGGRLKLEWAALRSRSPAEVNDALWWEADQLLGFVGLYSFGGEAEFTGMVDPIARRSGIATALTKAVLDIAGSRGAKEALMVVPRASVAGQSLASARGGMLDHSEYALCLIDEPAAGPVDPRITVRPATNSDAPELSRILSAAFGWAPSDFSEGPSPNSRSTLAIDFGGQVVGSLQVNRVADGASVYGFAIDPDRQGQGIARDVLRRVCRGLWTDGISRIDLEVMVENERALGLYTSIGFQPVTTEDYYRLATA